jgi:hypothetical protein
MVAALLPGSFTVLEETLYSGIDAILLHLLWDRSPVLVCLANLLI